MSLPGCGTPGAVGEAPPSALGVIHRLWRLHLKHSCCEDETVTVHADGAHISEGPPGHLPRRAGQFSLRQSMVPEDSLRAVGLRWPRVSRPSPFPGEELPRAEVRFLKVGF